MSNKEIQKKQEELIKLQIMAQEVFLQKKELESASDKQSIRQYKSAQSKYKQLINKIHKENANLIELQKKYDIQQISYNFLLLNTF